jgi:Snf7 protein
MKGMNRGLNLPQIQRIMNDFERESATMDMKEEMMSDAVDDVMDDDLEDEEEESDKILKQVLDEIGVGISQQVRFVCRVSVWLVRRLRHLAWACPPVPLLLIRLPHTACRRTDWPCHYLHTG